MRCDLGLCCPGRIHRCIAIQPDEDIQLRIESADALQQSLHQLDWREFPGGDGPCRLRHRHPVQVVHNPTPMRIGGHGSACGSLGAFIFATTSLACLAAAATSSGNCASALSNPARRANSSTIVLSMIMAPSIESNPCFGRLKRNLTTAADRLLQEPGPMLRFLEQGQEPGFAANPSDAASPRRRDPYRPENRTARVTDLVGTPLKSSRNIRRRLAVVAHARGGLT